MRITVLLLLTFAFGISATKAEISLVANVGTYAACSATCTLLAEDARNKVLPELKKKRDDAKKEVDRLQEKFKDEKAKLIPDQAVLKELESQIRVALDAYTDAYLKLSSKEAEIENGKDRCIDECATRKELIACTSGCAAAYEGQVASAKKFCDYEVQKAEKQSVEALLLGDSGADWESARVAALCKCAVNWDEGGYDGRNWSCYEKCLNASATLVGIGSAITLREAPIHIEILAKQGETIFGLVSGTCSTSIEPSMNRDELLQCAAYLSCGADAADCWRTKQSSCQEAYMTGALGQLMGTSGFITQPGDQPSVITVTGEAADKSTSGEKPNGQDLKPKVP